MQNHLAVGLAAATALPGLVAAVAARRALAERDAAQRAELTALESTSHEWFWQSDAAMTVTRCSPAVRDLLGLDPEDVVGRCLIDLLHPDDRRIARAELAGALGEHRGWRDVELRWLAADGHPVVLEGSSCPVLGADGEVVGFRGCRRPVPDDALARRRRACTVHRVRQVVDSGSVGVALQPIIDVADGRLAGVEGLARFPDARPPDAWFEEAHDAGVGVELELLALRHQLAAAAGLLAGPAQPSPWLHVSVNASPPLLLDPGFHETLRSAPLPLDRVVVEITEHAAVSGYDEIRAELDPYRARGLRLAVDDTGAGYASFTHVLRLRPDVIKLDRSLITDLDDDPARRAFVTGIVLMAVKLDAVVTAEGVERPGELAALRMLGVDSVQGYLVAPPTTDPAVWADWLRRDWATVTRASLRAVPS